MFDALKKGFAATLGVIGAIWTFYAVNDYIEGKKKDETDKEETVKKAYEEYKAETTE